MNNNRNLRRPRLDRQVFKRSSCGSLGRKVALVTGAIGDMGRAACRRFAAEGAAVVATDVTDVGASEFVEELTAAGHDVEFYKADITDSSAVNAMPNTCVRLGATSTPSTTTQE